VTRRVYLRRRAHADRKFGGALAASTPPSSAAWPAAAALRLSRAPLERVDEVCSSRSPGRERSQPRAPVVRRAGLADAVPAHTINKACASGMQAVVSAAQSVRLGMPEVVLAVAPST